MTALDPEVTAPPTDEQRCTRVLHIDWDGDPAPVREDIGQCVLPKPHEGRRHQCKDSGGSWFTW